MRKKKQIAAGLLSLALLLNAAACSGRSPQNSEIVESGESTVSQAESSSLPEVASTVSPTPTSSPTPSPTPSASPAPVSSASSSHAEPTASPSQKEKTLAQLQAEGKAAGAVCCVAFVGYVDHGKTMAELLSSDEVRKLFAEYPFLWEIPADRQIANPSGGGEVYCIVPVSPAASLTICPWNYDFEETSNFEGERGETLYTGGAEPVLIQGNISDILPDLEVTLLSGEETLLRYRPYTSLKDGSLGVPEGGTVYDFTKYRYPIEDD